MDPATSTVDGWILRPAVEADIDSLMSWFAREQDVRSWGGPAFRFPFTRATFCRDCHWPEMASFVLCDPAGERRGFGQFYAYRERIHLARLVVRPDSRGAGVGQRLVGALIEVAPDWLPLRGFSLYVFRDNLPALHCYQAAGFRIDDFPDDRADFRDSCYFLTRPATSPPAATR